MTYLTFLLIFLVPPILILAVTQPRPLAGVGGWRGRWSIVLVCVIALIYTTPWDNYLVYREVWWYGPERVLATIGYVPVEEYLFFLLQPILTGLVLYQLLARRPVPAATASTRLPQAVGTGVYLALALLGVLLLLAEDEAGLYMGLILAWACPPLAGLWYYGAPVLWRYRRTFAWAVGVPTLYLWIADRTAIDLGIWDISNRYSFDIDPLGLPIEEATFFLVTNLLVVQGLFLFLYGEVLSQATRRTVHAPSASDRPA